MFYVSKKFFFLGRLHRLTLNVQIVAQGHVARWVLCSAGVHFTINQAHISDPQRAWRQNSEPGVWLGVQGKEMEKRKHFMSHLRSTATVF